jgi:hypothetical protein
MYSELEQTYKVDNGKETGGLTDTSGLVGL